MMLQMKYFLGLGLGRNHLRIAEFLNIPVQHYTFGLGYKPTKEDYAWKAKKACEKALAQKEGRPIPMTKVKIPPTMNNYWIREGNDFLFYGFPKPFIDAASGKRFLSLEIVFDMKPDTDNDNLLGRKWADKEKGQEKDWASPFGLATNGS